MLLVNTDNARQIRRYKRHLEGARGLAPTTVDAALRAIADFEKFIQNRDFVKFRADSAEGYKKHLLGGKKTAGRATLSTARSKLQQVQRFFLWLSEQPGFRSRITRTDIEFFNLSRRDHRVSNQVSSKPYATLEQLHYVIRQMPSGTDIEKRDRAVMCLLLLTGIRVAALASLKLKHVLLGGTGIYQDADEVHTKFAKSFETYLLPVGDDIKSFFLEYVTHLREQLLWGNDDPLFPKTQMAGAKFEAIGLSREHWDVSDSIRRIWHKAFAAAGQPRCTPHSVRRTLTSLAKTNTYSIEQMQALSENLGHDLISTTIRHYGEMHPERRAQLISAMSFSGGVPNPTETRV